MVLVREVFVMKELRVGNNAAEGSVADTETWEEEVGVAESRDKWAVHDCMDFLGHPWLLLPYLTVA